MDPWLSLLVRFKIVINATYLIGNIVCQSTVTFGTLCLVSTLKRIVHVGTCYRWHVARMEEGRGVHKVLVGKSEGKRPLGRPRRRWEDTIKMDIQEVGRGCGDWMGLAQD